MRRRSIISASLAGTMLLSMYGTALAATNLWSFGSTTGYYEWTWIDYNKTLSFNKSTSTYGSGTDFYSDYGDIAERIEVSCPSSYSSYYFDGFSETMSSVEDLTIYNNCRYFGQLENLENLETIVISNNRYTDGEIFLDYCQGEIEDLPEIELRNVDSDALICVDCSYYHSYEVTVPESYGQSEQLYYTFEDSSYLESVDFESGTEIIPVDAFNNCSELTTVNIPDGVTLIEYAAFYGCTALNSIDIPASVEEIKYDAFEGSGITTINYEGTVSQWYGLVCKTDYEGDTLVFDNVLFVDGVTVHCSDGDMYIRYDDDGKYRQSPIGWYKDDNGWRYFHENGGYLTSDFLSDGGRTTYYFDENGYLVTGWKKLIHNWYYFNEDESDEYYNLGEMVTGWRKIGGSYYFFDDEGIMQTGWIKDGKYWYYLSTSGKMVTGWQKISNKWYYFQASGAMATGWQKISNKWYYFQSSGAMATGWQKISNKWYYFQSSGAMKTGWLKSGSNWYYLDSDGSMLSNCSRKISGKTYNFNASGVCTNP